MHEASICLTCGAEIIMKFKEYRVEKPLQPLASAMLPASPRAKLSLIRPDLKWRNRKPAQVRRCPPASPPQCRFTGHPRQQKMIVQCLRIL